MTVTRAEVCAVACSDAWRGAGEVLAHGVGTIPSIGVRLARLTHAPDLVVSDGEAFFMGPYLDVLPAAVVRQVTVNPAADKKMAP